MELHVHNGVVQREFLETEEIAALKKVDGFYVRFTKKKRAILVGTLSPIIRPTELQLYNSIISRYNISKILDKDAVLYGVIYGKGVKKQVYDAPTTPIICFYDLTIADKHPALADFETICLEKSLPTLSVLYSGPPDKKYENYLVRFVAETQILTYENLYRRLHWHSRR